MMKSPFVLLVVALLAVGTGACGSVRAGSGIGV